MTESAWLLLRPLLDAVRQRLQAAVEAQLVPEAARGALLAEVLGAAPGAAAAASAAARLAEVRSALADLALVVAGPIGPASAGDAARALAAVLLSTGGLVDAAAGAAPGPTLSTNGQRALQRLAASRSAVGSAGLLGQLGLGAAPVLAFEAGGASLRFAASGEARVAGGVRLGPRAVEVRLAFAGPSLEAELGGMGAGAQGVNVRLDLPPAAGDGLLSALIPASAAVELELRVSASSERGLTLGGSSRRATLPARAAAPGLELRSLDVAVRDSSPPALDFGATIVSSLGGMEATLQGFGVTLALDAGASGAGGAVQVSPKPPDGLGLKLDLGPARGGGFLAVRGTRYEGALQLSLGIAEVQAFGILDTRVEGGSGFSLILVLGAEFTPALELGLAFTLNAVGGLIGVQHLPDVEALAAGLRTNALDAVMFPHDVVAEAPRVLATLGTLFPQRAGAMVIGPLVRLGWGRPISFVTVDLGVLLSLPDPALTVLGRLRVAVPAPELPLMDLKVDLFGQITPERVLVRASLIDSRLGGYTIAGDFGFLADRSGEPTLAISAGGFHPRYEAPSALSGLRRLSLELSPPAGFGFRAEAYLAITTSSVQLGAYVQLFLDAGPVTAEGHFGFDAIVRTAPRFSFEVDLDIGASVQFEGEAFAGVNVHLRLEGPAPWRAEGSGRLKFLLVGNVPFEVGPITWGDARNPPPTVVAPGRLVREQLSHPGSWRAVVPDGGDRAVAVAVGAQDPAVPDIPVHPLGAFEVRQAVVPLERELARVGASVVPPDQRVVRLGTPLVGALAASRTSPLEDLFPPGQFLDLSDDEKLSRPAFEPMPSGVRLVAQGIGHGSIVEALLEYETMFADEKAELGRLVDGVVLHGFAGVATGAAGRAPLRALDPRAPVAGEQFALADAGVVTIRSRADLGPAGHGLPTGLLGYSEAARLVAAAVAGRRDLVDAVQLVRLGGES